MNFTRSFIARHTALLILAGAFAFLLITAGANGQNQTRARQVTPSPAPTPAAVENDDDYDVVRVTSNLVVVPVSVTDASGQPVLGLKNADFHLEEEGRVQEIAEIGDPDQVPLDIAILLDVSGSVNARFSFEQQAAARFLKQVLKSNDRATIYAIDQKPRLEQTRTTADGAASTLMSIKPSKGPTAFYDTVVDAAQYLAHSTPAQHRRVIVVISDGEDNYSEKVQAAIGATREAQDAVTPAAKRRIYDRVLLGVQREVQRAEIAFYSINPSGEALHLNTPGVRAQAGMQQLADATGGSAFVPDTLEDLDKVFRQISSELRAQYLLQYYSNGETPDGKFLAIKVSLPTRPQLRVRARQGYYAKNK